VVDLNGDGRPDLVVDDAATGRTVVELGEESGGFRVGETYPARVAKRGPPIVADLDGDGFADLAVDGASGADNTAVLFGDGTGSFSGGRLDLAAGRPAGIVREAGGGTPSLGVRSRGEISLVHLSRDRQPEVSFVAACGQDDAVIPIDLAPDGSSDIVTAARDSNAVVLRRTVSGWTELGRTENPGRTILGALALEIAPGVPRYLVTWNEYDYRVYDASQGGVMPMLGAAGQMGWLTSVQAVDVDGDGLRDLALTTTATYSTTAVVHRNAGDGTLKGYASAAAGPPSGSGMGVGDLDGNGWPEILAVTRTGVEVLRNIQAEPRVRVVAIPPGAHQQPLVRVVVNVEPTPVSGGWVLSVHLDGLLLDRWQGWTMRTVALPFPLSRGTHEIRVHLEDEDVGDSECVATVEVGPRPPRTRLSQLPLPWSQ